MKYKNILLLLIFLIPFIVVSQASAIYEPRDNNYFTKDDGEMSPEEMDLEALYVHRKCTQNTLQPDYYNCACIAGLFRQEREEQGIIEPQSIILSKIFLNEKNPCTDPVTIAGNAYNICMNLGKTIRERKDDNEEVCQCFANKVANDFTRRPKLRSSYIKQIKIDSMVYCNNPNNRETITIP